jgi:flagellar basal body rod protein FlgG
MKSIFLYSFLFIFLSCASIGKNINNNNDLLNDYKLLYNDLLNINTWGYKSFYNWELNRSTKNINISQGLLMHTGVKTDVTIIGEGFFKIRLENDLIGYTRSGNFRIDGDGNFVTTPGDYFLYDNIRLENIFIHELIRITKDHNIYYSIVKENALLEEIKAGRLLTYNIPGELLDNYKDAIYVIKKDVEYTEEIIFDNSIEQGFLELSNVITTYVVLRMYYILSVIDKNLIPNIEFKKELLKFQIENITDFINSPRNAVLYPGNLYYLGAILPFIKYDY